jgi:hypothetical protein
MPNGYYSVNKPPRAYEEVLRGIWEKCGRGEFLYRYITDCLSGPGTLMKMKGYGFVIDSGNLNSSGNLKIWKLSGNIADICEQFFGKVTDDRENKSLEYIAESREVIKQAKGEMRETMRISPEEQDEIDQIINKYGKEMWTTKQVKKEFRITLHGGKLIRWKGAGKIESAGRQVGHSAYLQF